LVRPFRASITFLVVRHRRALPWALLGCPFGAKGGHGYAVTLKAGCPHPALCCHFLGEGCHRRCRHREVDRRAWGTPEALKRVARGAKRPRELGLQGVTYPGRG
jgi:hypothetical protein